MENKEIRTYTFVGRQEDLNNLEKAFRHIEYLGQIGASRNIMIRVDGDGAGCVSVYKSSKSVVEYIQNIDTEKYNIDQTKLQHGCVGVYDIG